MEHDPRARETLAALLVLGCGAQDSVADEKAEKMLRVLASSLGLVVVDAAEHERLREERDEARAEAERLEHELGRALDSRLRYRREVKRLREALHDEEPDATEGVPPHLHGEGLYARTCTAQAESCRAGVERGLLPLFPTEGDGRDPGGC